MYWKEKRRRLGLNEEWKGEKKRVCGRKCATQLAKKIKMLLIHLVQQTAPPRCLSKRRDFTLHLKGSSLLMKVGGQLQLSFHGDCLLGPDSVIRSVIPRHALSRKYRPSFSPCRGLSVPGTLPTIEPRTKDIAFNRFLKGPYFKTKYWDVRSECSLRGQGDGIIIYLIFIQFLKLTPHLQLLHNIGSIP